MPKYRSFPTELLENPDVLEAGSDVQAVLLLLGLSVDDEGRGMAHSSILARKFGKDIEVIDRALAALVEYEIIMLYQVGRHHYFQICQWHRWQSLSKKTPSKFPAPPDKTAPDIPTGNIGQSREPSGNSDPREEKGREEEEKRIEGEGEEKPSADTTPDNVLTFPAGRRESTTSTTSEQKEETPRRPAQTQQTTREVAAILRLTVSDALVRIVADYQHDPLLRLLGEADNAREYIDNPRRNRQKQCMSPAFFRRWLRREHEDAQLRQSQRHTTAATGVKEATTATLPAPPGKARPALPKSLMHLADQDQPGRSSSPVKEGHQP